MNRIRIAPSLLASDFTRLEEQIKAVEQAGVEWLHLDVMDGQFVPNISFGPPVIRAIRKKTALTLDTHLMIAEPDRYLEAFRDAGSDIITVHQEACPHLHRTVTHIRQLGAKAGVALNPATSISLIQNILSDIDLLLVMTVNPGFGGQKYIKSSTKKIRQAREIIAQANVRTLLEVDGGIDPETAPLAVEAGADILVAGTSVFGEGDIRKALESLQQSYSSRVSS